MIRNSIYFLILILVSCGNQKAFQNTADRVAITYLDGKNVVLINKPLYERTVEAINNKYNYYKDYNASPAPLKPNSNDTLKHIFSEKNIVFFKAQLKQQAGWVQKPYVKQTIINREDVVKYNDKTIFSLSYPVVTRDKKFALMQCSSFHRDLMTGIDELLIFKKQKNKWIIYKQFELSLQ